MLKSPRFRRFRLREKIYQVIEVAPHNDWLGRAYDRFMIALISLNVVAFTFETVDSVSIPYKSYFNDFETFSVIVFTIEYILQLWTCTLERSYKHPLWGRVKFALSPLAIIDFISILPYYLFLLFPNWVFIRELHLLRLARLLKIGRYSESMRTLGQVCKAKRDDLFSALFIIFTLVIISASLLYYAEHAGQPQHFPNIPAAMWWAIITLTSVGYGDVYPITVVGKILGGIIAILGLGLVALPTGIITSGFAEEIERKRGVGKVCPHCGESLNGEKLGVNGDR